MRNWKRKLDKRSIDEKPPKPDEKIWKENQRIIECRYCQWKKNILILTKTEKEKLEDL